MSQTDKEHWCCDQAPNCGCGDAAPPRKADPNTWPMGGYPGGLGAPRAPLNEGPQTSPKERGEQLAEALKTADADLLTRAADIIENNAEALRQSSTLPNTDDWRGEADAHNEYLRDMDVVIQLRKRAKQSHQFAQLHDQLLRAQGHLVQSSHAYDQGCAMLNNALKNWPMEN